MCYQLFFKWQCECEEDWQYVFCNDVYVCPPPYERVEFADKARTCLSCLLRFRFQILKKLHHPLPESTTEWMELFWEDEENLSLEDTIESARSLIEIGYERDHAEWIARELVKRVWRTREVLGQFPMPGFAWVELARVEEGEGTEGEEGEVEGGENGKKRKREEDEEEEDGEEARGRKRERV